MGYDRSRPSTRTEFKRGGIKNLDGIEKMWAPCRHTSDPRLSLAIGTLNQHSFVSDIPYIGDHFVQELQSRGFNQVRDLVQHYQHMSAANVHRRLSQLLRNPRRRQCDMNNVRKYHVSDTNQCAFNSILLILQHFNVPGAMTLPLRQRGD